MVVGKGLIATIFSNYKENQNILIFASGVSNSNEINDFKFNREFNLLKKTIINYSSFLIVYFSTTSVVDPSVNNRKYTEHKKTLEEYITENAKSYLIFRVSNVAGSSNNFNTIFNFLATSVKNNSKIQIWKNAERNIIDKDDLKFIVNSVIRRKIKNKIINVALENNLTVLEIMKQMEVFFNRRALVEYINEGSSWSVDILPIKRELGIIENKKGTGVVYLNYLLNKYY